MKIEEMISDYRDTHEIGRLDMFEELAYRYYQQAAELSALRERVAELEADKERTREAVRMARQKLQATQINWQEECLFQCNDLLGVALDVCPSCTWRGDVTLVNGGCPYCKTNWHELRKGE